ncbi:MAG: energy-coupling factor transporter transmembrane protein EcfT [Methylobacterium mesophilicum]|nr:energy-coupling factor transporter transmembrane protein EcfT [Methylobacterium mesophilicum]
MLTALHVEGSGLLHRLGAGTKLAGLAVAGVALFALRSPWILLICLAFAALAYFTAGLALRDALRRIAPTLWSVLFLSVVNFLVLPLSEAGMLLLRILALVFAAAAVTATTPLTAMMAVVERLARPMARLGLVRPGDAGLALGLALRFVPDILLRYEALAEAHKARGLKLRVLTVLGPLIILTLRQADDVASAIDARGLRAPADPSSTKGTTIHDHP